MEKSQPNTFVLRDEEGNIIIDDEGCFTCLREDGMEFKVDSNQVDFTCSTIVCNVNGTEIEVQLNNIETDINETDIMETDNIEKVTAKNAPFVWKDASIKLFLALYKEKRDLVHARKIKTQKIMWKQISAEMVKMGYNVSAIQAENNFKTMERAYKSAASISSKSLSSGSSNIKRSSTLAMLCNTQHA